MPGWTCPDCGRRFGRTRQGHDCAPAMTLDEYLATSPDHERPVLDALLAHVEALGPVHVEPVSVGVFLKHGETLARFAQLRTMAKFSALGFSLRRQATHPRITRKLIAHGDGRWYHVANLRTPDDLDDALLAMLDEAYVEVSA